MFIISHFHKKSNIYSKILKNHRQFSRDLNSCKTLQSKSGSCINLVLPIQNPKIPTPLPTIFFKID